MITNAVCPNRFLLWFLLLGIVNSISASDYTFSESFLVSQLAYSPSESGARASITVKVRPSIALGSTIQLYINLPGFSADGLPRNAANCASQFGSSGLLFDACTSRINSLLKLLTMTPSDGVKLSRLVYFDADPTSPMYSSLVLQVVTLPATMEYSFSVCCFFLPLESPLNNVGLTIAAMSSSNEFAIATQPIKNSPELVRPNYFVALQLQFDPPMSGAVAAITVIMQSAKTVPAGSKILVKLPDTVRLSGSSEKVIFNTAATDWLYFEYYAIWDADSETLTFILREDLSGGQKVTLMTLPGEFQLPASIEANSATLQVSVRSGDLIDELIEATGVFQSDSVPMVLRFTNTALSYAFKTGSVADVTLTFIANRAIHKDLTIYVRLCGFQTQVTEVALFNTHANYFRDMTGVFDLPSNVLALVVAKTMYPVEGPFVVSFRNLIVPDALYENDPSLSISSSERSMEYQAIESSPAVGAAKTFDVSQLDFSPRDPENPTELTIRLRPTVTLFEGTVISLHLYGFKSAISVLNLSGSDAAKFKDNAATWDAALDELTLVVSGEKVILSDSVTEVTIDVTQGFRLPPMLSENDGILTVETRNGVVIFQEKIKSCPAVGGAKLITASFLHFFPAEANTVTRIEVSLTTNTDILPGTLMLIKLGGLRRVVAPRASLTTVALSGRNAPLFTDSSGSWDAAQQTLSLRLIDNVGILAGVTSSFFVEYDQGFTLPFAMYSNDPSLIISIPGAGILPTTFQSTTQVNRILKTFTVSTLTYGDGEAPIPGELSSLSLDFRPNTVLLEGSKIAVHLKGFRCGTSEIRIGPPLTNILDVTHRVFTPSADGTNFYGTWDAAGETLYLQVAAGQQVSNSVTTRVYLARSLGQCRLPSNSALNDPNLTIGVSEGVIIYAEAIKSSPAILMRTFSSSSLSYAPREPLRTHRMTLKFTATVPLTPMTPVVVTLTDFRNIDVQILNIHITGTHANLFTSETAVWDVATQRLTLTPLSTISAGFSVSVNIEESEGFLLPSTLYENDPRLMIASTANIPQEQIKTSDLVGDGPYANQVYCMFVFEVGTRRRIQLVGEEVASIGSFDPCSDHIAETPGDFVVSGFNMSAEDQLGVVYFSDPCPEVFRTGPMMEIETWQIDDADIAGDEDDDPLGLSLIRFPVVRAVKAGDFRVCLLHNGRVFDVGRAVVRAGCPPPKVLNGGLCMDFCAVGKVPMFGECHGSKFTAAQRLLLASAPRLMTLTFKYRSADEKGLATLGETDSTRQFFDFQFATQLADVLDIDPMRIKIQAIASANAGADIIVTAFVINPQSAEIDTNNEGDRRSPAEVAELLAALQDDPESRLYWNSMFSGVTSGTASHPVDVVLCATGDYRTLCPVALSLLPVKRGITMFLLTVSAAGASLVLVCFLAWKLDSAGSKFDVQRLSHVAATEVAGLDPSIKAEFARSWLEGRYPEDPAVRKRRRLKNRS